MLLKRVLPGLLISGYVVPLVAIGVVAGFIGGSLMGRTLPFIGTYRVPILAGLVVACFTFVMTIVMVFLLSLIINALAPSFGAEKNSEQALKLAVYSFTPAWVAGVLQILPLLGILAILGGLYGIYLMYLGLPRLMKCPEDKAPGYAAVVVICAIVLSVVVTSVGGLFIGAGAIASGALSGLGDGSGTTSETQLDPNSALGKLQALGDKLEESGKKAEAAAKAGDRNAEAAAALEGLGTLLGGGTRVEPLSTEQLKPFVPETLAGLPRKSSSVEKSGLASFMVSKAEATYSDGNNKTVRFELTDSGGMSGLLGLASWAGVQGEREDDQGVERTQKVGGRLVHEKMSKTGGANEFAVVLGDRFIVSATGDGVDFDALKAAVSDLDLDKLESMKGIAGPK